MTRRLPPHARLLEEPVRLPPGHPDTYTTHPDATDWLLAALHDDLWPAEEWQSVEDCPRIDLYPYETYGEARAALRRHRGRHRGLLRDMLYRVRSCPCGAYHVGPLFLRERARPLIRGGGLALLWLVTLVAIAVVGVTSPAERSDHPTVVRTYVPATPFITVTEGP